MSAIASNVDAAIIRRAGSPDRQDGCSLAEINVMLIYRLHRAWLWRHLVRRPLFCFRSSVVIFYITGLFLVVVRFEE